MQSQRQQTPRDLEGNRGQFESQELAKKLLHFSSDGSLQGKSNTLTLCLVLYWYSPIYILVENHVSMYI